MNMKIRSEVIPEKSICKVSVRETIYKGLRFQNALQDVIQFFHSATKERKSVERSENRILV